MAVCVIARCAHGPLRTSVVAMLMNHIPMDHLVALAEERRQRLLQEAAEERLSRPLRRRSLLRRLLARPGERPPSPGTAGTAGPARATAEDHDLCG